MKDLKDPRLMYLKAWLFLAIGTLAAAVILIDHPSLRLAALMGVLTWAFCRLYYFLFYVIEHYIDPEFRFSGILDAIAFLAGRQKGA